MCICCLVGHSKVSSRRSGWITSPTFERKYRVGRRRSRLASYCQRMMTVEWSSTLIWSVYHLGLDQRRVLMILQDQELPSFDLVPNGPTSHPFMPPILPQSTRTLLDDYLSRYPSLPTSGDITPASPSSAVSSRPGLSSNLSPSPSSHTVLDQYDQLIIALQPLLQHLDVIAPTSDRHLTTLHDKLRQTEKTVENGIAARQAPTDEQRILLEGINATRTLARYFERSLFDRERKPRVGQVAEAIEDIASMYQALGLDEGARRELLSIASDLRA